eukprot:gene28689-16984_t
MHETTVKTSLQTTLTGPQLNGAPNNSAPINFQLLLVPAYQGSQTGEGDKGDFHIGVGGYCQTDLQDPIVGPT